MLFVILGTLISGLIIGALGRLAVPGRQSMGCLTTALTGIVGSIAGGIVARMIWLNPSRHRVGLIVLEVLGAALIVYLWKGPRRRVA